eukprot:m.290555 g.290555  ORF g.290555 m.290555 type:complete len:392 (-) comp12317_c0_seq1:23-1198(-)
MSAPAAVVFVGVDDGIDSAIYARKFDCTGATTPLGPPPTPAGTCPMAMCALDTPAGQTLYSVDGSNSQKGAVSAFRIADLEVGGLTELSSASSGGDGPCHIALYAPEGEDGPLYVAVANYGAAQGAVALLPVDRRTGAFASAEPAAAVQHGLKGADATNGRQGESHAHMVCPSGKFLYVCDLGLNVVRQYDASLTLLSEVHSAPGAGPRHMVMHPTQPLAFVVNELNNTVDVLAVDPESGALTQIEAACGVSTLPAGWDGPKPFDFYTAPSHAAGIALAGETLLLVTNRGHDSIAALRLDLSRGAADPRLELIQTVPSQGRIPWSIEVVFDNSLAIVSNQFGANLQSPGWIAMFELDPSADQPIMSKPILKVPFKNVKCTITLPFQEEQLQ